MPRRCSSLACLPKAEVQTLQGFAELSQQDPAGEDQKVHVERGSESQAITA